MHSQVVLSPLETLATSRIDFDRDLGIHHQDPFGCNEWELELVVAERIFLATRNQDIPRYLDLLVWAEDAASTNENHLAVQHVLQFVDERFLSYLQMGDNSIVGGRQGRYPSGCRVGESGHEEIGHCSFQYQIASKCLHDSLPEEAN